jgi:hypothetical protein
MSSALPGEMEFSWLFDQALVLQCSGWAALSAFSRHTRLVLIIPGTYLALPHPTRRQ